MSDRPYRKAMSLAEALKEMKVNSGTQFDPVIVKAFIEALDEGDEARVGDVVKEVETQIESPLQP